MFAHNGEYLDGIKRSFAEKGFFEKMMRTTHQEYLYQNLIGDPDPYALLVVLDSVNLERVKKLLKRLPYKLPTIVLTDELPKGPKINQLMCAVPDIATWDLTVN